MAEPSKKSDEMRQFLDNVTQSTFGRKRHNSIVADICVSCGGPATEFKDELSRREYSISGLCQKCQDEVFDGSEG